MIFLILKHIFVLYILLNFSIYIYLIYKNPKNESSFYRRNQYSIGGIIILNYYIPAIFISTLKNYVM